MWSYSLMMSTVQQVEYYFSPQNLQHDEFLRGRMDEEGWVPVKDIISFRRMRLLEATDHFRVALALHFHSQTVEVDMSTLRIRAKALTTPYVLQTSQNV